MKFSRHFYDYSTVIRDYLTEEMCIHTIENHVHKETQEDGRIRYWSYIEKYNRYLRVVVENDGETILTAHFDRDFVKRRIES